MYEGVKIYGQTLEMMTMMMRRQRRRRRRRKDSMDGGGEWVCAASHAMPMPLRFCSTTIPPKASEPNSMGCAPNQKEVVTFALGSRYFVKPQTCVRCDAGCTL
jgi:hypothetical protein